jgi:hypothetical protein
MWGHKVRFRPKKEIETKRRKILAAVLIHAKMVAVPRDVS